MKLSVIVPVYKAEAYLHACVDSLLNQTLRDLEIILVDDGSPDGCQAILDDYAARFPDTVRTKTVENGGQGRARNFGAGDGPGEYLGFVDSDDWVEPEMYEKLIAAAEREGGHGRLRHPSCYEDGGTERLRAWREERPWPPRAPAAIRSSAGAWWSSFAFPRGCGMRISPFPPWR